MKMRLDEIQTLNGIQPLNQAAQCADRETSRADCVAHIGIWSTVNVRIGITDPRNTVTV
jgi:hypothetical protein